MNTETHDTTNEDELREDVEGIETLEDESEYQLSQQVTVDEIGPCKKKVAVVIPRQDIDHFYKEAIGELGNSANVPGFRPGHVPQKLLERRFKQELADQVKQQLLLESLDQLVKSEDLDPINEPELDIANIEVPDEGDFSYDFEVEVRPEFDVPDYSDLQIKRRVHNVTDDDVKSYRDRFLSQSAKFADKEGAAEAGDFLVLTADFRHEGNHLHKTPELTIQIKPTLRFYDAELTGFEELMAGVTAGETRESSVTVSQEASSIELRGEELQARFQVKAVKTQTLPELTKEFLDRVGFESAEELNDEIRGILTRQHEYEQRQAVRDQVLDKITDSADWDLPEKLVRRQVDNALRREILEMQQAGFTTKEIQARENELRQHAVTTTRQALKEHFVLDKIAEQEKIEVTPGDLEAEIELMAMQRGESPRRVRARLQKSGMIENLEAQVRERKAVDFILDKATFIDEEVEAPQVSNVEAVPASVCGSTSDEIEDDVTEEAVDAETQNIDEGEETADE